MWRFSSLVLGLMFISCAVAMVDMNSDLITTKGSAATLYVGTGPGNYTTIQLAIDMAQPGDTVFVYSGLYSETLLIDKTLTLTGQEKETTVINGIGNSFGMHLSSAGYINISGFTVQYATTNFQLSNIDHATISDNIIKEAGANAMKLVACNNSLVENNHFSGNLKGLLITSNSNGNIIKNNSMNSTHNKSINIEGASHGNLVVGNQISGYDFGILVYKVDDTRIDNNMIRDCGEGLRLLDLDEISVVENTLSNNDVAIRLRSASALVENCTIQDSVARDFELDDPDSYNPTVTLLNTSFDKDKVFILDGTSSLDVRWYLTIMVMDEQASPLGAMPVRVRDNENGSYDENFLTDADGYVSWIPVTQYIQTQSGRSYRSPHNISAFNTTGQGYATPEISVNGNKRVKVRVYFDTDGDGIRDIDDKFPWDPDEWKDSDRDGVGDNTDAFPLDANETADSDDDGVGDNADEFPEDPLETVDSDGDGFGDNGDDFPLDPDEWNDADGDGHGDNEDEFPEDGKEWRDSDGDGVGDNADFLPQMDNGLFMLILAVVVFIVIVLLALLRPKSKGQKGGEETPIPEPPAPEGEDIFEGPEKEDEDVS